MRFQLRLRPEQKRLWQEAANGNLSSWIRRTCDDAAVKALEGTLSEAVPERWDDEPEPPGYNPVTDSYDGVVGEISFDGRLAVNCARSELHWKLRRGQKCKWCRGVA